MKATQHLSQNRAICFNFNPVSDNLLIAVKLNNSYLWDTIKDSTPFCILYAETCLLPAGL